VLATARMSIIVFLALGQQDDCRVRHPMMILEYYVVYHMTDFGPKSNNIVLPLLLKYGLIRTRK